MISRNDITVPDFYKNYVQKAGDNDMLKALKKSTRQFKKFLKHVPGKKIDYAYADGKWTIRELLQHIIDAERVFSFRALWFSRKDVSAQPGFDENSWAQVAKASGRDWDDLIEEFFALRKATEIFFRSLDDEQLQQTGVANNNVMSVAGLGFVCAGHVAHHMGIMNERYLNPEKKKKKKEKEMKPVEA